MMKVESLGDFNQYVDRGTSVKRSQNSQVAVPLNAKRSRPDHAAYKPGNIIKVTVTNFTTYSYAEFSLSPRLNMIIGPNGTGKSTLVSAICLGLGGKLDLLKRKLLKSMIKTGQETSEIEIVIMGKDDKSYVINREFTENSSEWKIDGRKSNEKTVDKFVKDLNIQLDNLCHFLPQERVAEFAGLTPERLLLETQRTLNSGDLYLMHENLIRLEKDRDDAIADLSKVQDHLEKLRVEEKSLANEVEKLNQFNEKSKQLKYHKLLLPYAIVEEEKVYKKHLKKVRDQCKAKLEESNNKINPLVDETRACAKRAKVLEESIRENNMELEKLKLQETSKTNDIDTLSTKLEDQTKRLNQLKVSKDILRTEIESLHEELEKLVSLPLRGDDLESMKETKTRLVAELHEIKKVIRDLDNKIESLNESKNDILQDKTNTTRKLKNEESILNSRDGLLKLSSYADKPGVFQTSFYFHKELRKEVAMKGHYFESPAVTCQVESKYKKYGGILERVIGTNTMMAVTFNSDADYRKVPEKLQKINCPTRITKGIAPSADITRENLQSRYGFEGYLSDCLSGPNEVLNMLNANSKLNLIPYASSMSPEGIRKILTPNSNGRIPFLRFVIGDELFSVSVSKYGSKQVVHSTETIKYGKFFGNDLGFSEIEKNRATNSIQTHKSHLLEIEEQLKNNNDEKLAVVEEISNVANERTQLNKELEDILPAIKERDRLEAKINHIQNQIKAKENSLMSDESSKIEQIKRRIMKENGDLAQEYQSLGDICLSISELKQAISLLEVQKFQHEQRANSVEKLIAEFGDYRKQLTEQYEEAKRNYKDTKETDAARQIKEQSKDYTEEIEIDLAAIAKDYLENALLTKVHVQSKIQAIEDELSVIAAADGTSIDRLKDVERLIEDCIKQLPRLEKSKDDYDMRIENIQKQWEPELSRLVFQISRSFKKKFKSVASDGEVQLKKLPKFRDWRLEILVKFRQESALKILDRQSQSGGERAVSTIFFVMALQGLTKAPLRIVDEINQGMDPNNEKVAHKFLVHTACHSNDSQYFLVTPKLLTGLYYHPSMKVHCIYTGPLIDPFNKNDEDFMDFTKSF